ncbi:cysteine hydrolase family protein [Ferrovibrio sp.]|uniref:cysteine hydrolase family protein n=1 Tax=Ferrovibrio sp. TaxID=1917215 RepID=UPI0035B269F9
MSALSNTVLQRLDPAHSALLVIDMQNDFCAEGGYVETAVGKDASACRAVAAPIMDLVRNARRSGVPVYWVIAIYDTDKVPPNMLAKQRERSMDVCCGTGSWGAGFFGVEPLENETVIAKHCFSAFQGTDLEQQLRERSIRTVVFTGVQTNICVETSLRDGFCRGFNVVLAEDCVASHTKPLHDATVANTRFLFGDVLGGVDIAGAWRENTAVAKVGATAAL